MAITVSDIEAFHRFALARVSDSSAKDLSFDDLFLEWDALSNRDEIQLAIREGISDVRHGRTRPVEEFNRELREQYGIRK